MWSLLDSLLPPGQQEAVIEQVEVHRFDGELELWAGNVHHLSVHFQEFTVLHQPPGLRDQREYLQRRSRVKNTPQSTASWRKNVSHFSFKMDFLIEVNEFLHPLHWLHAGITLFDDLKRHAPTPLLRWCLTSSNAHTLIIDDNHHLF